jgi:hypothetical protein
MATARAAPQGGRVALTDVPPLDEQPIGPVQEEHRDRAVKAARSQVRVELAQRADRAPSSVDKFDARTTIVGIAHPTLPPGRGCRSTKDHPMTIALSASSRNSSGS